MHAINYYISINSKIQSYNKDSWITRYLQYFSFGIYYCQVALEKVHSNSTGPVSIVSVFDWLTYCFMNFKIKFLSPYMMENREVSEP